MVLVVGIVESITFLERTQEATIDRPRDLIWLPVDHIGVIVAEGVAPIADGNVLLVFIWSGQRTGQ